MKPKDIKDQVLDLNSQGKTVLEIAEILQCSKTTVYYHITPGYRDKVMSIQRIHRKREEAIRKKQERQRYENTIKRSRTRSESPITYTFEDFKKFLEEHPTCYLTGRPIDISDNTSYQVDHIVPHSKGGTNDLSNLGVTCRDANMAKSDMLLEDFIQLCEDVLINRGYKIIKS